MLSKIIKIFQSTPEEERILSSTNNFEEYSNALLHSWLRTLTLLGFTLVPIFFILDIFIIPSSQGHLLPLFAVYRFTATAIVVLQFVIINKTHSSKYSFLHGYVFSFFVSLAIVLMTINLGGFNSPYYAGLNLVIIAVNLLLPWKTLHSGLNGLMTILLYVVLNVLFGEKFELNLLVNNLYFMSSTVVIATSINHVKHILIRKEFEGRKELRAARDALWGEMEIAKQIQTALIPEDSILNGYEIAGIMQPAESVGGDYYDIVPSSKSPWVMIGDVSGHGVESGLIMMMTQTSVRTSIFQDPNISPSNLLVKLNHIIKENIALLHVDRYLTITAINLGEKGITFSGSHQDIIILRKKENKIETYPTFGTWVGMLDEVEEYMKDNFIELSSGDMFLLFTDGITELGFNDKEMFGDNRLIESFHRNANLPIKEIVPAIIKEAFAFHAKQEDDITLVVIRKL